MEINVIVTTNLKFLFRCNPYEEKKIDSVLFIRKTREI